MDSNATLILINVIISLIHLADTFINKLKNSKCILGELNMKEDIENPKQNNKNINVDIIKQLDELNKFKNDMIDLKNINNNNLDQSSA